MSAFANLNLALAAGRKAYDAYSDYRDRKVSETYEALSSAAETYAPKADQAVESAKDIYSESRDKAGNVTKAARVRLEKALEEAQKQSAASLKDARKSGKKLSKKAAKVQDKAVKKVKGEPETHWVRNLSLAALATSGVAAIAYAVINKKKKDAPGTQPPRVEVQLKKAAEQPEIVEEEPKLVYSTQTPVNEEAEPVEEAVVDSEVPLEAETEAEIEEDLAEELTEAEEIQAEFDKKGDK
ncbi:hypothetical protein [Corynebacterium callunae]|uniref:Uncharacterized protein n=1 Tax=Corynebacterium callunae DSM 20147 TaxID=1121353 RepID=M1UWS6_9CORY|nr:hypothetical protein [Corynebacterium callunae]AGG65488.1 hypothetical protein H924_00120 [Corynebacterium callunae DSM 20147]